jgi:hypothetical protein
MSQFAIELSFGQVDLCCVHEDHSTTNSGACQKQTRIFVYRSIGVRHEV